MRHLVEALRSGLILSYRFVLLFNLVIGENNAEELRFMKIYEALTKMRVLAID